MTLNLGDYSKIYFWMIELETETDYAPETERGALVDEQRTIAIIFNQESARRQFENMTADDFFTQDDENVLVSANLVFSEWFAENDAPAERNRFLATRDLLKGE